MFYGALMVLFGSCSTTYYVPDDRPVVYEQPVWAPGFNDPGMIHYYYFPDLGMYYDVPNRNYVYMDNGSWYYTPQPPSIYSSYDFNNAYVVALSYNVQQPWIQHSVYATQYPPYYYNTSYPSNNASSAESATIRGFNENDKKPLYRNAASNNNTQPDQTSRPDQSKTNISATRTSQPVSTNRTDVAQPVKVQNNTKPPQTPKPPPTPKTPAPSKPPANNNSNQRNSNQPR